MLIKNARLVVTQNTNRDILENADILIQGNTIVKIGKGLQGEPVLDADDMIVMPGLINAHTHNTMTALRGVCDDEELQLWLDAVVKAELAMTPQEQSASSKQGVREMLRTGTTTFCDMYVDIRPTFAAALSSGMRAILFRAYFDAFGDDPFDPSQIIELNKETDASEGRIRIGLGPHSLYGCSEKLLKQVHAFSEEHELRKHIHLAETRKERFDIREKEQCLPLEYLDKIGFLDKRTTLVHNVWLTKGELDTIKTRDASMVHCPTSNMKLAGGGVMPLMEAQQRGIFCGLGTDSAVSNNSLDMFSEMKFAALLHKHHRWDPTAASAQMVLDMATIQGARAYGLDEEIGSLEPGKKADIVMLDLSSENLVGTTKEHVVSNLVYAASGYNVDTVIVDGKIRVQRKELLID
jgi:5-methylthioadenosine/S-adenosylhomocysteine deaminase